MNGSLAWQQMQAGSRQHAFLRKGSPCLLDIGRRCTSRKLQFSTITRQPTAAAGASSAASGSPSDKPEKEYLPFPRLKEGNPYKLLGVPKHASFEDVQDARNYLYEEYKWHEPSREAIELAYESLLSTAFKNRRRQGFRPPRTGRRTDIIVDPAAPTLNKRIMAMFDPTISTTTFINEAAVYFIMALWALFSSDQSFPLAGAFAYSVYKFQSKRMRANPEGPFFGGSPIVGAVISTGVNIGLACGLMTLITAPLQSVMEASIRQVGAFMVIMVAGVLGVYMK